MSIPDFALRRLNAFDDGIYGWEEIEDAQINGGTVFKSWSKEIEGTRIIRTVYVDLDDLSADVEYSSMYSELAANLIPEEYPFFVLTSKGVSHPAFEIVQEDGQVPVVEYKVSESDVHEFQVMELPWISYVVSTVFDMFEPIEH